MRGVGEEGTREGSTTTTTTTTTTATTTTTTATMEYSRGSVVACRVGMKRINTFALGLPRVQGCEILARTGPACTLCKLLFKFISRHAFPGMFKSFKEELNERCTICRFSIVCLVEG